MREIKFRGKRSDNGEWVYGDKIASNLIGYIEREEYNRQGMGCGLEDRCIDNVYDAGEYGYDSAMDITFQNVYEVDPETVGQDTGLKDKNGKEIYEGDIVRYPGKGYDENGVWCENGTIWEDQIVWNGEMITVEGRSQGLKLLIEIEIEFEVIGTIHDNP